MFKVRVYQKTGQMWIGYPQAEFETRAEAEIYVFKFKRKLNQHFKNKWHNGTFRQYPTLRELLKYWWLSTRVRIEGPEA